MPKATIGVLCAELMRRGLPAEHPAVAVFDVTRADEVVLSASIATLPQHIAAIDSHAPCIILIGVAAAQRATSLQSSLSEQAMSGVGL